VTRFKRLLAALAFRAADISLCFGFQVYVRRNLLCGLLVREPSNLADFNSELRRWEPEVPT